MTPLFGKAPRESGRFDGPPLPAWTKTLQRRIRQRCTSRALLPADLAAMPAVEIAARLNELRPVTGR